MRKRSLALLVLALALASCSPDGGATTDEMIDATMLGDGSDALVALEQALAVADDFLEFDPLLDPAASAEVNAAALEANARDDLAGCGTVTRDATSVTIALDPAGCTLPGGATASGAVVLAVSSAAGTVAVAVIYDALAIGPYTLDGTATVSTSDATTYAIDVDLATGEASLDAALVVTAAAGTMTVEGTISIASGADAATRTGTLTGVVWNRVDCYPSAGTVSITSGRVTQTLTFDATTAGTGTITVTQGRRTTTATLPAYGECPS